MKSFFISILLIIPATCFFTTVHAQEELPDKKEAEASKGRAVIVQIEVPNSKTAEKLKKKGNDKALDIYVIALAKYNALMKAAVEKYWKFSDSILYKTPDEIAHLIDAKSTNYTILRCVTSSIGTGIVGYNHNSVTPVYTSSGWTTVGSTGGTSTVSGPVQEFGGNLDWSYTELKNENWEDDRDYWNGNTLMEFWRIEKMKKGFMKTPDVVCRVALPEIFPDTASLVYGVQMAQYYLHRSLDRDKTVTAAQQMKMDYTSFKTKTLYVRKDRTDPELSLSSIKELYAYPFKLVSKAEYESIFFDGKDGNVFLVIAPQVSSLHGGDAMFFNYVFDASQGRQIATVAPPIGAIYKMAYVGGNAGKPVANEHTFKSLGNFIRQLTK